MRSKQTACLGTVPERSFYKPESEQQRSGFFPFWTEWVIFPFQPSFISESSSLFISESVPTFKEPYTLRKSAPSVPIGLTRSVTCSTPLSRLAVMVSFLPPSLPPPLLPLSFMPGHLLSALIPFAYSLIVSSWKVIDEAIVQIRKPGQGTHRTPFHPHTEALLCSPITTRAFPRAYVIWHLDLSCWLIGTLKAFSSWYLFSVRFNLHYMKKDPLTDSLPCLFLNTAAGVSLEWGFFFPQMSLHSISYKYVLCVHMHTCLSI